jgi:hypothetical protein
MASTAHPDPGHSASGPRGWSIDPEVSDRTMLLHNILANHQTRSYDQAVAVFDDLLAMPGHEEAAAHYGGRKKLGPPLHLARR